MMSTWKIVLLCVLLVLGICVLMYIAAQYDERRIEATKSKRFKCEKVYRYNTILITDSKTGKEFLSNTRGGILEIK